MPSIETAFELAVENIANYGDTDIFPPPFENHVFHDRKLECIALLKEIHAGWPTTLQENAPVNESHLALVGYTGFRWATEIDPIWNAYFLALVLSLGEKIEQARLPYGRQVVFSYRFEATDNGRIFKEQSWPDFQARSAELAAQYEYVVVCDIADFYSRVYHHRLENALIKLPDHGDTPSRIMDLLKVFSRNTSYGLPVGGPAARILSELLLNRVDRLLVTEGVTYCRFSDDFHIFASSREEAFKALRSLSQKLVSNEGLTLQKSKTRILTSREFLASSRFAPPEDQQDAAESEANRTFLTLSLRYDPYSPTAAEDYENLKEKISQYDILGMLGREIRKSRIHHGLTRRLLRALEYLDPDERSEALVSLVDNLETLAPLLPQVMRVIEASMGELQGEVRDSILAKLRQLIASDHYLMQVEINLGYTLRVLAKVPSEESEVLIADIYQRNPTHFVQRDILLIMARYGAHHWVSDKKNYYSQMHPWQRRAFLVASYALSEEGGHWRRSVRDQLSPFDLIVRDWAAARSQQPGWEIPV